MHAQCTFRQNTEIAYYAITMIYRKYDAEYDEIRTRITGDKGGRKFGVAQAPTHCLRVLNHYIFKVTRTLGSLKKPECMNLVGAGSHSF